MNTNADMKERKREMRGREEKIRRMKGEKKERESERRVERKDERGEERG